MANGVLAVTLRKPHPKQEAFINSPAPRRIIKAGRRSGKTTGIAILAVRAFLEGRRVLYATPIQEQIGKFWFEVKRALAEPLDAGVFYKNESMHFVERPSTANRLKAKSAYNPDTFRGDTGDLIIFDEWQLMAESTWGEVAAPMLLDTGGRAVFIYTPPSLHSRSVSKARDKRHAAKMYKEAEYREGWERFHFTSYDNPHINQEAIGEIQKDMTALAFRQEILAEDVEEAPGAMWRLAIIDQFRVDNAPDRFAKIVVSIDLATTSTDQSDETGILVSARAANGECYVLEDASGRYTPDGWAREAIRLYKKWEADRIVAESNQGGDMVSYTIKTLGENINVKLVHASRGKQVRAEPIAALYEQGKVHHVGHFPLLEDQLVSWEPLSGYRSPDRLDALVWGLTELFPPGGGIRIFA